MIKTAAEMIQEIKTQMRGGKGEVEMLHIFKDEELLGKARLCAKLTLHPGASIGVHDHTGEEEIFYITKGEATINDDGILKKVVAGDAILTGNGASHGVENTGEEILEMIAVILVY